MTSYIPGGFEPRREPLGQPAYVPATPISIPPPPVMPAPKRRRTGLAVLLVIASLIAIGGVAVIAAAIANGGKPSAGPSPTCEVYGINGCTTKGANGGGPAIAPTTAAARPAPKTKPDPKGFTIGIKVLTKHCFGSAGCNVTFRIDPSYNGEAFTDTTTWEIVYQINGAQDPYTNKFKLTGSRASFESEESVQTSSSSAVLTAVVVDVLEA